VTTQTTTLNTVSSYLATVVAVFGPRVAAAEAFTSMRGRQYDGAAVVAICERDGPY
jgi:hypothetical protein